MWLTHEGWPWFNLAVMADSLAGRLLIATPVLEDGNFYRTVVFMLAHDEGGSMGVVLNRPQPGVLVADHLPAWRAHASAPAAVFSGGPVEPAMALALASARDSATGEGWRPMAGGVGLLDLGREPDDTGLAVEQMRVFVGYAGWGAGQLEGEIAQNAWFVVDARPGDVFSAHPESLWRDVLSRQRSDLKIYALFPEDPRAN